jgi:DNA-binding CsgD family transcriptional regulator
VQVHVLEPGRPPAFVHPVVRSAVRANLPAAELAGAHARAARQLRGQGAAPDRIALHLLNAPPSGDAHVVEDLRAAARDALARGAPELAARLLRRALREPPAADVTRDMLLELGAAEMGAAEMERSLEHLTRAVELSPEPAARGGATLALAGVLLRMNRGREAHDALAAALPGTAGELRARLEGARLQSAYASPRAFAAYRASVPPGVAGGRLPGTLDERIDHGRQALWESLHGSAAAAREHARAAWGGGELLDALGPTDPITALPVTAQLWADDLDSAIARLTAIVDESRRRGSVRGFVAASHFRAIAWWRRGALLELEADAGNALEHGAPYGLPLAAPFLAMALLERGQPGAAEAALARALPDGGDLPAVALFGLEARARVDVAQRRPEAARAVLERAAALERAYDLQRAGISQWRAVAAPLLHAAGEDSAAEALAREWVAAMEAYGAARAIGIARTTLAAVGPPEGRTGRLEAAVRVLRGASARLDLARALVELGAALRRDRRRGDARDRLREGRELALRCGATALAARAEQELAAAGEQTRRVRPEQRDELTAHELRVARMAADGMTNREIAQSLFVTQKTIEAHLSSVYRKLDIRSRVQLVRALADAEAVRA